MDSWDRFFKGLTRGLDQVAGWALVATMVLVVGNVVFRYFGYPLGGTYEWVGFFTSLVIGLALAYCAVQEGHIAVTFLVDKLPGRAQGVIDLAMGLVTLGFLLLAAWETAAYATSMVRSGQVAETTQVPFYPFIYAVAFGLLAYCLVVAREWLRSLRRVVKK